MRLIFMECELVNMFKRIMFLGFFLKIWMKIKKRKICIVSERWMIFDGILDIMCLNFECFVNGECYKWSWVKSV